MENQMQTAQTNQPTTLHGKQNHGGHEIFDTHEILTGMISAMDQYKIFEQFIQDAELKTIAQRQGDFLKQTYNTMVESFKTGQDPTVPTTSYSMQQGNDVVYGIKPAQPKKPITSVNEVTDECVSTYMLSQVKGLASMSAQSACELTNPVLRRIVADSVPNLIEMSYEIFLYQNKHHYYQVAQLQPSDMAAMMQSYDTAPMNQMH
ncbi:Spore coat protein CotF [Terribacillus halophilus]|uniref:Spore coat protein CotF n=1 Tax=Terribacillus halophilus TaxID=361279 RepID=A0A1G6JD75_9BACI|nr:spore coat protein [Terribacillus halophilus]SDC16802.1 Spore coat protein CotF [Terribacillus halophilus]